MILYIKSLYAKCVNYRIFSDLRYKIFFCYSADVVNYLEHRNFCIYVFLTTVQISEYHFDTVKLVSHIFLAVKFDKYGHNYYKNAYRFYAEKHVQYKKQVKGGIL